MIYAMDIKKQKDKKIKKDYRKKISLYCFLSIFFLLASVFFLPLGSAQEQVHSSEYVNKAWSELGKRNFEQVYEITDECIEVFSRQASEQAQQLDDFPPKGREDRYEVMNDVATCYFIKGEAYMRQEDNEKAEEIFQRIVQYYPYAQAWDPRGWFWSLKEKSEITLKKLTTGMFVQEVEEVQEQIDLTLHEKGSKFPIDYTKYGVFKGQGTGDYSYVIEDQEGLAQAAGQGVYPDTTSFRYDPRFVVRKEEIVKADHWGVLNERDLELAFYKWNIVGEPQGVSQFYRGDLLERSGLIEQALKAYYAVVVHFPRTYAWTYFGTPWSVARAAIARIHYLLENNPEIGYELQDAFIKIINGFDNDISNDEFIVNSGRFVRRKGPYRSEDRKRELKDIVKETGTRTKLVKYRSGDWQLLVEGEPFIVKGMTYTPTKVGESPDEGTLSNWTTQDTNNNGIIDGPYEAWVDKNRNNLRDPGEEKTGDFELMKEMGVNCIREYHAPRKPDKAVLSSLYEDYGIMTILGDFLGKYAIGSGADWAQGTDYSNPEHQKNMMDSVEDMVNEYKDEPYILMWLLGNENVYGVACNADKDPESFFEFVNKVALRIKEIDPTRPVAIASGDALYLDLFGKNCPDVDIYGTNSYRGKHGFASLWQDVKDFADKPVLITEYGTSASARYYTEAEAEAFQAEYHRGAWGDIQNNTAGFGVGNSLGGVVFQWLDEWWKSYEPYYHDRTGNWIGPFLGGSMHEEWLGLCSQGDGSHSPFLRQLRPAYFMYQEVWDD
jgi:tetratricopeptide (TPR) repeat protein